jgi:hypothetical protein
VGPFCDNTGLDGPGQVRQALEEIKERVYAYYGYVSLVASSPDLARLETPVPEPEELILADTLFALHTTVVDGGYLHQPWLLMQMLEAAVTARSLYTGRPETKS